MAYVIPGDRYDPSAHDLSSALLVDFDPPAEAPYPCHRPDQSKHPEECEYPDDGRAVEHSERDQDENREPIVTGTKNMTRGVECIVRSIGYVDMVGLQVYDASRRVSVFSGLEAVYREFSR